MLRKLLLTAFTVALAASWVRGQFEVASIKLNKSGERSSDRKVFPGGRLTARNSTLLQLVQWAYGVRDFQVAGAPGWAASERYDIEAKPETPATSREAMQMLQMLLSERFKLTLRRESRELPAYALVVAKNGPKLREAKDQEGGIRDMQNEITGQKVTMESLARVLSQRLGRTVLDETGLKGNFELKLEFSTDENPAAAEENRSGTGPSIFTALQEQLGLKLEARKAPVEVLVIDHAEKIPSQN